MTETRIRVADTLTRKWPEAPSDGTTLHLVGDIHAGSGIDPFTRRAKVLTDLNRTERPTVPLPQGRIFTGDMLDNGFAAEYTIFDTWADQMPVVPSIYALGNHELWGNARTPADFESMFGQPKNYVRDIGDIRVITVGPDSLQLPNQTTIFLSAATVTWLDQQLTAAGDRPCAVVCHAPLKETVLGGVNDYSSVSDGGVFAVNAGADTTIREVLASHRNAKAWISGHTHTQYDEPTITTAQIMGGHTMAMVNSSALAYTRRTYDFSRPLVTSYMTWLEDRIEVRYRENGAGGWPLPAFRIDL